MIAVIPKSQHEQYSTNLGSVSNSYKDHIESFNKEIIWMDNEYSGLRDLANFQQGFIPSDDELLSAMEIYRQELGSNNNIPLEEFMYDYGKNGQLFDGHI